ncbi:ribulose phosphate epimerase [Nannocystis punicea]|uniref:Ribulose phosphate epimerase n=1 Tax=Nannocystis punicea TaxID=2995304 RepID=A0ABY7HBW1_9BACT|nr:ribulose phosphate epimerase [Nannocystis poenicansa]WAS96776.1 ribulose phosphate epimerase [Nannocystis poenicansa]
MGTQGVKECDPWVQDCPIGQKCVPFPSAGEGALDSLHCAPVAESPEQAGDPCVLQGTGSELTDNCDVGLFCWDSSCVPLCSGSPDAPVCDDPADVCLIANDEALTLCLPKCDPLAQDCEADEVCLSVGDTREFLCLRDASGDGGQEFDACELVNGCDPGLACLGPALATECDDAAFGCCLKFCDLTMPTCAGAGAECLPWFEAGMAPAGLDDVGVCGLP